MQNNMIVVKKDIKNPVNTDIENGVRSIAADILQMQNRTGEIKMESNLFELGLESINVIELLTAIETNFDITIDVEDLSGELFENFSTLVNFVSTRMRDS